MIWTGFFEDEFGLASDSGEGSSRAVYEPAEPPAEPLADGEEAPSDTYLYDDIGTFKYLGVGQTYTGVIESHYCTMTITLTFLGDDITFSYVMTGVNNFRFSENFQSLFFNDPIKWDNTSYDSSASTGVHSTFSVGNISTNPYVTEDGTFVIQTVSGKTYAFHGFMLGPIEQITKIAADATKIMDGRIVFFKQKRTKEWLDMH